MYAGQVQDFRSVKIADPGNGALVEQGDLDGSAALCQALAKFIGREGQGVGAERSVAQSLGELPLR
jgi:hypothetical protein